MTVKPKMLQYNVDFFMRGMTPDDEIIPDGSTVGHYTIDRTRLHRWIDMLIDSGKVDKIDIGWYDASIGYVKRVQDQLVETEKNLDELENREKTQ